MTDIEKMLHNLKMFELRLKNYKFEIGESILSGSNKGIIKSNIRLLKKQLTEFSKLLT